MNIKTEAKDLVWARVPYTPYWPARIVNTPPELGRTPKDRVCVLFFGTKQFGFIDTKKNELHPYSSYREKFVEKKNGAKFIYAVEQMDNYISNPTKYRSNAFVKRTQIQVKVEGDVKSNVKRQLNVKRASPPRTNNSQDEWRKEKEILVEKIVCLKSENQKIVLELRNIQSENASHLSTNQELIVKCNVLSVDLEALKRNHSDFVAKKIEKEKQLSDMSRENKLLLARIKQLETGIQQQHEQTINIKPLAPAPKNHSNNVYEVEKIIAQKKQNGIVHYKIRWKGFGIEHDTWEKEANLQCPRILNAFKKSVEGK